MRFDVFLDSGIFIAWLVSKDQYHSRAEALFQALPAKPATSLAVVAESYGWFLHRFDERAARTFRLALGSVSGLTLLPLDVEHHAAVERRLERLRGLKLTYVDASSLVFIRKFRIQSVWSTDRHLAIEGARVLPDWN